VKITITAFLFAERNMEINQLITKLYFSFIFLNFLYDMNCTQPDLSGARFFCGEFSLAKKQRERRAEIAAQIIINDELLMINDFQ